MQRYAFFLNWRKNKLFITHTPMIINDVVINFTYLFHFFLANQKKVRTFATPKLKKNEENISTITQKKS